MQQAAVALAGHELLVRADHRAVDALLGAGGDLVHRRHRRPRLQPVLGHEARGLTQVGLHRQRWIAPDLPVVLVAAGGIVGLLIQIIAGRAGPIRHAQPLLAHYLAQVIAEQVDIALPDLRRKCRVGRLQVAAVAPVLPGGFFLVVATPQHDAGVMAQPAHVVARLGHHACPEGRIVARLHAAAEHEVLPDQQAQLISDVKERIVLVVAAAPVAQHVHVGVARGGQHLTQACGIDACGEGIERNDVGALGEDLHAVDDEGKALPALAVFLAAQFDRAQANALLARQRCVGAIIQASPHGIAILRTMAHRPPAPRRGQLNRQLNRVLAGLQQHRALHLGHVAAFRILHIHSDHRRTGSAALLHLQQHRQLRLLRAQCIGTHGKIGQAVRVPGLQVDPAPDPGGDITRAPVPAEVVGRLAREVADHRLLRLIAIGRRVIASDLVRHCLHARQQRADR